MQTIQLLAESTTQDPRNNRKVKEVTTKEGKSKATGRDSLPNGLFTNVQNGGSQTPSNARNNAAWI